MYENYLEPVTTASWPPPGDHALRRAADGLLVAELRGEIDLATVTQLRCWLDSVVSLRAPAYLVDLRAVDFIDSAGLNLLLRLRRRVLKEDGAFAVLCTANTRRLMGAHGTLAVLDPATTPAQAAARLSAD
ncbi:STAS domain-containing protein [Streptomyces fulvoviolaceus]|uniref:STAS domain-containing protein n=1 Tax=Streptomyces fulvoviolaceus TaxID=285535 RepID=UPI0005BD2313|nr:STAS domain-containing protein [Streptomyces fulvoviolaceus]MCT9075897.1 STAS domain-containing protein [Streptomyces fulvoviolaceus]